MNMLKSDFYYDLPAHLIAQQPLPARSASRLLCVDPASSALHDRLFSDLPDLLRPGDLLVFNNTQVIPARLFGHKSSGGRVEILVERLLAEDCVLAHVRASKAPKVAAEIQLDGGGVCRVMERRADLFVLQFNEAVDAVLTRAGHMPLPPYIERPDSIEDWTRYQTVFASRKGAVAAPTAGLHFDEALLARLQAMGIERAFVTLHVGSGTFRPVRTERLEDHVMHAEYGEVPAATVEAIQRTRAAGGRVVAVGTTVVRALESAAQHGELAAWQGDTAIFITPGYAFRCVDVLLTNFHLPESTLLALVCAFAGYAPVMAAYQHAVMAEYRFFSYGDAMLLSRA